jgi:hypothetical protein
LPIRSTSHSAKDYASRSLTLQSRAELPTTSPPEPDSRESGYFSPRSLTLLSRAELPTTSSTSQNPTLESQATSRLVA